MIVFKFIRKHWESLLFTLTIITLGFLSMNLTINNLEKFYLYFGFFGLLFFGITTAVFFKKRPEKHCRVIELIDALVDIVLAFVLLFVIKEPNLRLVGAIFIILPVVKSIVSQSWVGSLYLDRGKMFFGILFIIFSPYHIILAGGNYSSFIALGWILYIVGALMIYYLIIYGRIITEEEEN